jgi:catechol 2,3-dioxygenase-like lactoylglutathione lyase family enzyme
VQVADLGRSCAFYEVVLEPLLLTKLVVRDGSIGFGKKYPEFWLNLREQSAAATPDHRAHVALRAPSDRAVCEFRDRAINAGAQDDGPPGIREAAMTTCFGAFIRDLDGNRVEAMHFPVVKQVQGESRSAREPG